VNRRKIKIQDFTDKTNLFFGTLAFAIMLATWMHLGAPQKLHED
jgi:hypothetical protein